MRRTHRFAALALVMATPVVVWWMIGDISEDVDPRHAEYTLPPLELSSGVELRLGVGASVVAAASFVFLAMATRRRVVDGAWWGVIVPLLLIGIVGGVAYRVMTAATSGANFGAGFLILFGPVLVVPLLTRANRARLRIARTSHHAKHAHGKDDPS